MPERLRVGVLGAAWIADRALLPALRAARNADPVSVASRDPARAKAIAARHGVPSTHPTYDAMLEDPAVDAVYIALVNSAHAQWTIRALQAGKHVLCEKPLAMNAGEARSMAAAAARAERTLMEAFMYRFHPRMQALHSTSPSTDFAHAAFSFRLEDPRNYRMASELGGGALLDVGCYTLDVIRWFLGEPAVVRAAIRSDRVDMTVAVTLGFDGGAQATAWASFESAEHQGLALLGTGGVHRMPQPFTAWRDPDDPYQIMVEEFAESILAGEPPPRSLADSIGTAELIDRVRSVAQPIR
jgi:D-xylose 1-dehydrogenase (NADP+, D-xylono-1,5-lactone-forming)